MVFFKIISKRINTQAVSVQLPFRQSDAEPHQPRWTVTNRSAIVYQTFLEQLWAKQMKYQNLADIIDQNSQNELAFLTSAVNISSGTGDDEETGSPTGKKIFKQICCSGNIAAALVFEPEEIHTMSGSDANHINQYGIPVIDALGPYTYGIHTTDEHTVISSIRHQTLFAAALIQDLKPYPLTEQVPHELQQQILPIDKAQERTRFDLVKDRPAETDIRKARDHQHEEPDKDQAFREAEQTPQQLVRLIHDGDFFEASCEK